MVCLYEENIPSLCDESDEPDNAASPASDTADRNVRYFGDDRAVADQLSSVDGPEDLCGAIGVIRRRHHRVPFLSLVLYPPSSDQKPAGAQPPA